MNKKLMFFLQNFKVAILFGLLSIIFFAISGYLHFKNTSTFYENMLLSVGSGLVVASLFNVVYEYVTKKSFSEMLNMVVKTLASGIIVHPTHHNVISREEALKIYLHENETVKIMTSTAGHYVKEGEAGYYTLKDKITNHNCSLQILLYFPIYEPMEIRLGQRHIPPQQLINEHKSLIQYYDELISTNKVNIKFFTVPFHTNFIIIGNERFFGAPLLHTVIGRDLPCFEIYPAGHDCLFRKFVADFDFIFTNKDKRITLDYKEVKKIYFKANFDFKEMKRKFIEKYVNGV